MLNPDMSNEELRLHMGELTANECRVAKAAIAWANAQNTSLEWQSIETAPVAVLLLLYSPDRGISNPQRMEIAYADNGRGSHHAWATHWMPLPKPPSNTGGVKCP